MDINTIIKTFALESSILTVDAFYLFAQSQYIINIFFTLVDSLRCGIGKQKASGLIEFVIGRGAVCAPCILHGTS